MKQAFESKETIVTPLDLTQSQLMMWAGQELSPNAPLYNMVLAFTLHGAIQEKHFQAAFQALVDSSDAMRLVFLVEDGLPKQHILPALPYAIEILDWSQQADALSGFNEWAEVRSQMPFDLSKIAFDTVLIKLSEEKYIWYLNQHHLVTDAWTVSVLYEKMAVWYQMAIEGRLNEATPLPAFQHYIAYEQATRHSPKQTAITQYWEEKVKQLPPPPRLYAYNGADSTSRSQRISVNLGIERSNQLRALAQEPDVRSWTTHLSLFNIFATTVFAFLYRISGQQQLALGTPAHNRPTPAFKATPGVFIEIFPMCTAITEEESFGSLLQKVRTEANSFFRYAQPGAARPELSRGFNTILNYIHAAFSDFNGIPMQSEWIHPQHCDPRHHLRIQVHDMDASGSIQLHFDLNYEVFDEAIRQLAPAHFIRLLDAFIADRSQAIMQPSLLSTSEFEQLVTGFNSANGTPVETTSVVSLFEKQVEKTPSAVAIQYEDQILSYQALNEKANQLAHYLKEQGIGSGKRVALYLKRSPELLISILGVLKSGATYIPIATEYPKERVSFMLQDAEAALLITHEKATLALDEAQIPFLDLTRQAELIATQNQHNLALVIDGESPAYIMYTSGSTGRPKGVVISHRSLGHYIHWASQEYVRSPQPAMALFTSIGFDLTVTSLFLPLTVGGRSVIYEEDSNGPDFAIFKVLEADQVDIIKLTPSHLALLKDRQFPTSRIKTMIVGGEDFKSELALAIQRSFGGQLHIYNEYGPTEATVGCIIHLFTPHKDLQISVPIGKPAPDIQVYLLDPVGNPVPQGVVGELFVAGKGLALGYWNQAQFTQERFVDNPFVPNTRMYRTGDLARLNRKQQLEYLGRSDQQVKLHGRRIELGEIESVLSQHPDIQDSVVLVRKRRGPVPPEEVCNCVKCGLPSNYPNVVFDEAGICQLCHSFEGYQQKIQRYFKTTNELQTLFAKLRLTHKGEYDCLMLLSGGKDSTYALAQLVEMGLKVLTFTLDNGYISDQAKANIRRVVNALGVDHVFGQTPAMNAIFVDSLQRYCNVCDGCFKTIYTLSIKLALEKNIPYIVTGLSRGQFFETRLTEELFRKEEVDIASIDQTILEARKAYHRADDAIKRLLDVSMFEDDKVFEKVQFLDFYRYTDVSLDEMLTYLDQRLPWVRPTDTGRSTNCLINQVGIYIHKKERGYSNYAFPYSWDVRIGHKTRDASLDEINEEIHEPEVLQILKEIGYYEQADGTADDHYLVAYYVGPTKVKDQELRSYLSERLPAYMLPTQFIQLEAFPLTPNGKIDRDALPSPETIGPARTVQYEAPRNEIEELLASIWSDVLHIEEISIHENFLEMGGNSLAAIRLMARTNEAFELELPLNRVFEWPTIAALAAHIEATIVEMLEGLE
ncbi:MAG: amino acid adenylation domain-containing protein [Saprospiraceae bacterium]